MIDRLQENQRLDRLPQPHVIRQATTKLVFAQEVQPIESGFLVWAQLSYKTLWQRAGCNALEIFRQQLAQAAALVLEFGIQAQVIRLVERLIDQCQVVARETQPKLFQVSHREQRMVSLQPDFGDFADRAIGQLDEPLALAQQAANILNGYFQVAEIHHSLNVEPIDAG